MYTQNDVYKFLKDSGVFYVATVDGSKPKNRPFSFVMENNGKICFTTDNRKDVFKQMTANPDVEICAFHNGRWLRYRGRASFCTTVAGKKKAMELFPTLKTLYKPEDKIMEVFYLDKAEADFCSMKGENETIKL